MLIAHLVPGYFAAVAAKRSRSFPVQPMPRVSLWAASFSGCVFPDADVIAALIFKGTFGHQVLWTHSILGPLSVLFTVWVCARFFRPSWIGTAFNLFAVGWVSHIVLDLLVHGTPLLYPFSMVGFELAPKSIVSGGLKAYVTHPLFLLEPLFIVAAVAHLLKTRTGTGKRGAGPAVDGNNGASAGADF